MRDSTFTLRALLGLDLDWEAGEFMQFVADLEPNPAGSLQIMYGIDGRRDLTEQLRDDLAGYAGARPVRVGQRRLRPAPERRVRGRGELQRARDLMERLLKIASPLGLYAEEFDVATSRHLGNFPQAFSHLALLEAALRIAFWEILPQYGGRGVLGRALIRRELGAV